MPVSIVCSPANIHDSTKFIDVMESISEFVDDDSIKQIVSVYADKGYDSGTIRDYLKTRTTYTTRQGLLLRDSLDGWKMVFTGLELDMKEMQKIILG